MKYKVGDKTLLGEIEVADENDSGSAYKIGARKWFSESEIDAIVIKPKRNIDHLIELWEAGRKEEARRFYSDIEFCGGLYLGDIVSGLLSNYVEPRKYPVLTPEELKAVKWLFEGGAATIEKNGYPAKACSGGGKFFMWLTYPNIKFLNNSKWITTEPINLKELLEAQEENV